MSDYGNPLLDFLEARLADDEAIARTAGDGIYARWEWDGETAGGEVYAFDATRVLPMRNVRGEPYISTEYYPVTCDSEGLSSSVDETEGPHIARHDPARVLADVAAKRAILAEYVDFIAECGEPDDDAFSVDGGTARAITLRDDVLRRFAAIHADHPDYDPTWSPS